MADLARILRVTSLVLSALISAAGGQCHCGPVGQGVAELFNRTQHGEGTYYYNYDLRRAHCGLWPPPPGLAAANLSMVAIGRGGWRRSLVCGTCIELSWGRVRTQAYIGDSCAGCRGAGDIDFAQRGDGRWPLSWKAIPCPLGGRHQSIQYRLEGSNRWYMKIQVRNTRYPVVAVERSSTGRGRWRPMQKTVDGHWQLSGAVRAPVWLRLKAVTGESLVDRLGIIKNNVVVTGGNQVQFSETT